MVDKLIETSTIELDRPQGTAHPRFPDKIYPLDYGYLKGVSSSDGDDLDIWVGTLPQKQIMGVLACVDLFKRDMELKLLYACSEGEMQRIHDFASQGSQRCILIKRS